MADPTTELPELPNPEIHHEHRDVGGGWLRPTVFGMMDGLVSNFALIAGVSGASSTTNQVALAGWAGLVGGAFSMAVGEYVSVQSQNESAHAEIATERYELEHNAPAEQAELAQMYIERGVAPELAEQVAKQLSRDPEQALLIHVQEELGVDPNQLPSPWTAAFSSFASFSVGAFIPLLPYLFGAHNVAISAVLAILALFGAGALASRFTVRGWVYSGMRQLVLGVVAAAITFGVGHLFHVTVGY
ncbi:MAG: vacuolar iron transporter family protein [Pseudonocardiales bacterium]|jgi:VIT1/CCC1 family predicted Fe2+/Mn2+ transporter|nr:vacuolar iron transporter family protein [Pseudonocardiales bacterium]MDT4963777.1 vacuolar iron transporter family protein [Pseudonocardiales bacterium]